MTHVFSVKSNNQKSFVVTDNDYTLLQYVDGITVKHLTKIPCYLNINFGEQTKDYFANTFKAYMYHYNNEIKKYTQWIDMYNGQIEFIRGAWAPKMAKAEIEIKLKSVDEYKANINAFKVKKKIVKELEKIVLKSD